MRGYIAKISRPACLKNRRHNRLARLIAEPFACNHHNTAQTVIESFNLIQKLLLHKGTLWKINQMGRITVLLPSQRGRGGGPASIAPQ